MTSLQHHDVLLQRFVAGDRKAFATIYKAHWPSLFELANRRLSDAKQAEDVVQDVFITLWEKRQSLGISNLKAYLQTAVRNRIFNLVAREKVKDAYFVHLEQLMGFGNGADAPLEYRELWEKYERLLESLPTGQQQAFRLRFEDDLPTRHIAEKLNISQKTVQNQLLKAVNRLKTIFTLLVPIIFC